jgi:cytochrome c-type biogenesis protein CcmH/NrfG
VEAWVRLGSLLFLQRDFGSAADALGRALRIAPDDVDARHQLAMVLLAAGDQPAAMRELERVLELAPGHPAAATDLAVCDLANGRGDSALRRLDVVLRHHAEHPRARFYYALALHQVGRATEARTLLTDLAASETKYGDRARQQLAEFPPDLL